jgi:hypothetical protein
MFIGSSFTSFNVSFNEKAEIKGGINVTGIPSITSMEKKKGPKNENALEIKYKYEVVYDPAVAKISIEGKMMYQMDKPEDIIKHWKNEKKVPVDIFNMINLSCIPKAMVLAECSKLPPPPPIVNMPAPK